MTDLNAFVAEVAGTAPTHAARQVQVPGFVQPLPAMVLARHTRGSKGTPLVVCFHGAIDRTKRHFPAFEGRFLLLNGLQGNANVVSIADPSLSLHPNLRAAWFAGDAVTDTPNAIAALVVELVSRLLPDRVVFVGGSTGAHAALVQSIRVPGSVAVIENPILHISRYSPRHIAEYRQFCWPQLPRTAALPASVNDNAAGLYANGFANTVVLLNNTRDSHFWSQASGLLNAIGSGDGRDRCLLYSDFFADHPGHSFPPAVWARWVLAACGAPSPSIADIGQHYAASLTATDRKGTAATATAADMDLTQRIYQALTAGGQAV